MELDQETYKMTVETNTMLKALNEKMTQFVGEVNHCLKSQDERIREVEVRGSIPSREAAEKVTALEKRITELETFKAEHEGAAKESARNAAIIATIIGLAFTALNVGFAIWKTFA